MGILSSILTASMWMFIALIVLICMRVFLAYFAMGYYRKQGIRSYFAPLLGIAGVALKKPIAGMRRFDEHLAELVKNDYERGAFVHTGIVSEGPVVTLLTAEYVKEYIAQEDKFVRKTLFPVTKNIIGFFDKHGPSALKERNLFQEIFHYEKIKSLVPSILREINAGLIQFGESNKLTKDSFTKVDLSQAFRNIMFKLGLILIFSQENLPEDSIEVHIAKNSRDIVQIGFKLVLNPLISLFPSIFKIFPSSNSDLIEMRKRMEAQKLLISQYIDQRQSQGSLGDSAFDRIITHNNKCREDGRLSDMMDLDAIQGTLNVLMFAAFDSSQNMSILNLCLMAERPDIREHVTRIAGEIFDEKGNTTADIVDAHKELAMYLKEANRLESPSIGISDRIALKDVTIKDITVRKGDEVLVFLGPLNMDSRYFPDPSTFKFDRFSKDNEKLYGIPKQQVLPFGLGKRGCIGRSLAELAVKLLLTSFCR